MALGYVALVSIAWFTGSDLLSATCVVLLVSAVLAPRLSAGARWPWLLWLVLVAGVVALTLGGHGRTALDLVPLTINLALGVLFGLSLGGSHTPLVARAIIAIEGRDHLALPKVSAYARALTVAWTTLFVVQSLIFAIVLGWWLPNLAGNDPARGWALSYLHIGGFLLPALFMLGEYAFRRWYLRHVPHVPPQVFLQQLVRNWPQLLHDNGAGIERGVGNAR